MVVHPRRRRQQQRLLPAAQQPPGAQHERHEREEKEAGAVAGDAAAGEGAVRLVDFVFLDCGFGALVGDVEDEEVDPDEGEGERRAREGVGEAG